MTSTLLARRLRGAALMLATAAVLSACGGSNDRPHEVVTPPPPVQNPPPPVVSTDSFFALVLARIGSLLDTDEPVPTDAITATAPETTEPEPVPSN